MQLKASQLLLVLVLSLTSLYGDANTETDSLENKLQLEKGLSTEDLMTIHYRLSTLYSFEDFGKSLEHSQQVLRLATVEENEHAQGVALRQIAVAYENLGDGEKALECFIQMKARFEKSSDKSLLGLAYYDIARLQQRFSENQDPSEYYLKAIEILRNDSSHASYLPVALTGYASYLGEAGKNDEAIELFKEAEKICIENNIYKVLFSVYGNFAQIYMEMDDSTRTLSLLDTALIYANRHGKSLTFMELNEIYGEALYQFGSYNRALSYLNIVKDDYSKHLHGDMLLRNVEFRAKCHKNLGNYELSSELFEKSAKLADSLRVAEGTDSYEKFQVLFSMQEKEIELELAEQELALSAERESSAAYRLYFFVALAVILLLTIVVLYLRHKSNVERLNVEIAQRDTELTSYAMDLVEKNKLLKSAKSALQQIRQNAGSESIDSVETEALALRLLNRDNIDLDEKLLQLEQSFYFNLAARYPDLSEREKSICALIKLDYSSKEIGEILNVSSRSVDTYRHRIRKKMGLVGSQSLGKVINEAQRS